jgi:apolipoprotein D and lipocalin family protein
MMGTTRWKSAWRSCGGAGVAVSTALFTAAARGTAAAQEQSGPVRSVAALDLERYAGRWHEVARLPNRFQRRCVANVTATYELQSGGIKVVNECLTADGDSIRAEGRARLADRSGPASRLKVRFAPALLSFIPAVWADYWVLDLTDDYGAALVGTPDRRFLWVLSRQPELDSTTYERMVGTAARQGFDVTRLLRTGER